MLQLRLEMLVEQYETIKKSKCLNKELKLRKLQDWIDIVHLKIVEVNYKLMESNKKCL